MVTVCVVAGLDEVAVDSDAPAVSVTGLTTSICLDCSNASSDGALCSPDGRGGRIC